jgi:hypothetical protein
VTLQLHDDQGNATNAFMGVLIGHAVAIVTLVFACGIQYQTIQDLKVRDGERKSSIEELNRNAALTSGTAARLANLESSAARIEGIVMQLLDSRRPVVITGGGR